MKFSGYVVLFAALSLGTGAQASKVAPTVTGTVQRAGSSAITVNGHTYEITADTKSKGIVGSPQPGQQVILGLSSDGSKVIVINAVSPTASH
jgi:hypothetical protein